MVPDLAVIADRLIGRLIDLIRVREEKDYKRYRELILPAYEDGRVVATDYLSLFTEAIEKLEAEVAAIEQAMEEMAEEHSGEEGLLEEAKNDKDKLTKASVAARLKETMGDADAADEGKVLNDYLALIEKEAANSAKVKDAQDVLMAKVVAQYGKLTEDEIRRSW